MGTEARIDPTLPIKHVQQALFVEEAPGVFRSSYGIENFYFTDRLDLYVVVDQDSKRALFVDVGMPEACGTEPIDRAFERFGVDPADAQVFITHFHDDHDGNTQHCLDAGVARVLHGPRIEYSPERLARFLEVTGALREGDEEIGDTIAFLMNKGRTSDAMRAAMHELHDGSKVEVGEHVLEVLETPGHTVEHVSLIDREAGVLFAGDHLLASAPGQMQLDEDSHLLKRFFDSLRYLKEQNLNTVLMCHTDSLHGTQQINAFIDSILETYAKPLGKMKGLLESRSRGKDPCDPSASLSVYEAARAFYSYLKNGGLDGQPPLLRARRVAIAFAYLEYLFDTGFASRAEADDGAFEYRCVAPVSSHLHP